MACVVGKNEKEEKQKKKEIGIAVSVSLVPGDEIKILSYRFFLAIVIAVKVGQKREEKRGVRSGSGKEEKYTVG